MTPPRSLVLFTLCVACLCTPSNQQDALRRPRGFQAAVEAQQGAALSQTLREQQAAGPAALHRRVEAQQEAYNAVDLPNQQHPATWAAAAVLAAALLFAAGVAVGWHVRPQGPTYHPLAAAGMEKGLQPTVETPAVLLSSAQSEHRPAQADKTAVEEAVTPVAAASMTDVIRTPAAAAAELEVQEVEWRAVNVGQQAAASTATGCGKDPAASSSAAVQAYTQPATEESQQQEQQGQQRQQQEDPPPVAAAVANVSLMTSVAGSGSSNTEAAAAAAAMPAVVCSSSKTTLMAGLAADGSGVVAGLYSQGPGSGEDADIKAAAHLVAALTSRLHLNPSELSTGERLQMVHMVLQAWQAQQARRFGETMSQLGWEANVLRGQQLDVAQQTAAHKQARDAHALSLQRTAEFRHLCSDTLWCGLAVMVAVGARQVLRRGLLHGIGMQCGGLAGGGSRWGLWAAWRTVEAAKCYALAAGDALLGLAMLFAAPWLLYRTGLLSDYHSLPVTKLLAGLGLVCGYAGYLAVGRLGGDRAVWLCMWETWVALHVAFSAAAHRLNRTAAQTAGGTDRRPGAMYEQRSGWLAAAMWATLGVVLPAAAGVLPFRS